MDLPFYLSYAALWIVVVFETLVVIGLVKAHGHGHQAAPARDPGGEQAPEFEATDVTGAPVGTGSLRGQRAALLFVSPDCPTCSATPVQVEALLAKTRGKVVVVCRAGEERCAALAAEYDLDVQVVADADHAISDLFRITATPTAIALTPDGQIGSRGYAMSGTDGGQDGAGGNGHVEPSELPEIVLAGGGSLVGSELPPFEAEDVLGERLSSRSLIGRGAALLFTSPDCASCEVTRDELAALAGSADGDLVVICHAPADRCVSLAHYYEQRVRVVADPDHVLHDLVGVTTLPILVSVGQDGRIEASGPPRPAERSDERLQQLVDEMRS